METLSYEEKLPVTHLAALLWIISILLMFSFVWGDQTGEVYSTWGRINLKFCMPVLLVFTLCLTNPSVPFALAVIELICSEQQIIFQAIGYFTPQNHD